MGATDDMTFQLVTKSDGFRCAQAAPSGRCPFRDPWCP